MTHIHTHAPRLFVHTNLFRISAALIAVGLPSAGHAMSIPRPRELTERAYCEASNLFGVPCKPDVQVTWEVFETTGTLYKNCTYGFRVGAGWGSGDRFYDQVDRCALLHDNGCWSVNHLTGINEGNTGCNQDVNFMACIDAVEPQSDEEAAAKDCIQTTLIRTAADICEPFYWTYGRGYLYPLYTPDASSNPGYSCDGGQYAFHQLSPGMSLLAGQTIYSDDGAYHLVMQTDGNAVIYDNTPTAIWNSGTQGSGAVRLIMQTDGNLVIYTQIAAVWNTGTQGHGTSRAMMQDDGNLVIIDDNGSVTWNSKGY